MIKELYLNHRIAFLCLDNLVKRVCMLPDVLSISVSHFKMRHAGRIAYACNITKNEYFTYQLFPLASSIRSINLLMSSFFLNGTQLTGGEKLSSSPKAVLYLILKVTLGGFVMAE